MCLDPCEAAEAGVAHFPGEVMEGPLLRSVLIINGVAVWKQSHRLKSCKTRGLGTQGHIMGLPHTVFRWDSACLQNRYSNTLTLAELLQ